MKLNELMKMNFVFARGPYSSPTQTRKKFDTNAIAIYDFPIIYDDFDFNVNILNELNDKKK
jgi:hypothetical protein